MDVSEDVTGTLRAQEHGHQPCVLEAAGFCTEHSADARSIGYEEERSPTLRAGVVPAAIALEKDCYFLNLWEVLADENGDLNESYAQPDGYHVKPDGYSVWVEYLAAHT